MAKTFEGHEGVVDKEFGEGHGYKSSATLRDRAVQNMKAWFGSTIS